MLIELSLQLNSIQIIESETNLLDLTQRNVITINIKCETINSQFFGMNLIGN